MLWKITVTILTLLLGVFIFFINLSAMGNQVKQNDKIIKIGITLEDLKKITSTCLVPVPQKDVKHKVTDARFREYYRFNPPFSVVMKESDIKSYFEFVFEDGILVEINQYNKNGTIQKKLNELYLF